MYFGFFIKSFYSDIKTFFKIVNFFKKKTLYRI